jgi:acyl-CoA reductase-like NAD-dependent aldehyde dehydrogenase
MKPCNRALVPARGRFIGGAFTLPASPARSMEVRSPADPDDLIGVFPVAEEDVPLAVASAQQAAPRWAMTPLSQRLRGLERLGAALDERAAELTVRLQRESGRPNWECGREVRGLGQRLRQVTQAAPRHLAERHVAGRALRESLQPLGVVAVIGPALLPIATSHTHILAALAAGNCVVWKPSPLAVASAQLYAEAAAQLPPGVLNVVFGDDAVGRALAAAPGVDGVVFTGTAEHGAEVRALDDRRRILHLGAKNGALVLADADLDRAAAEVAAGAFLSAGQRCTATARVLVDGAVLEPFVERLIAVTHGFNNFWSPLGSEERRARFLALREQADGERLYEGTAPERGWYATPTIHLVSRRLPSEYQLRELRGPDLAVHAVEGLDDGLSVLSSGLCASLFSQSELAWRGFTARVRASVALWNCGTHQPPGALGFGGCDGARGGSEALLDLCRSLAIAEKASA